MGLSISKKEEIEKVLKASLRKKFKNYNPEPASMPFHTRLLGKDKLALFSFIHSLNTNFGTAIFEPVAIVLAKTNFPEAKSQEIAGNQISSDAHREIQKIMDNLSTAVATPNKPKEIEILRKASKSGEMKDVKLTKVDVFLRSKTDEVFMFDVKTAKPNAGGFKEFKRTLLEWTAAYFAKNPNAKIQTSIAIPYNPYEPKPYSRWTMRGMLDLDNELKVAEEFWDFFGGKGIYQRLLDVFEKVGLELRPELDEYFKKFQNKN